MNLPQTLKDLLAAQDNFDSEAYADCFSDNAVVYDEGHVHPGKEKIRQWNELSNRKYRPRLEPVHFNSHENKAVLTTRVSGTFEGSPILLDYNFEMTETKIISLTIVSS